MACAVSSRADANDIPPRLVCLATFAPALVAGYMQHIELADEVAENDRAIAGHESEIEPSQNAPH